VSIVYIPFQQLTDLQGNPSCVSAGVECPFLRGVTADFCDTGQGDSVLLIDARPHANCPVWAEDAITRNPSIGEA
jgi:hypothetical protein